VTLRLRTAALTALLFRSLFAQGAGEDGSLLADIRKRLRAMEGCARTIAIDVAVTVAELDGAVLDPPGRAAVRWSARGGRSLIEVSGVDLDHGAASRPAEARRVRLHLPGGITETVDLRTGAFSRDQRTYLDAMALPSDLGPGEFLWTFCGAYRSAILERRDTRIARTSGVTPSRLVEIEADDPSGRQRIAFLCAEEWGFLPCVARMSVRVAGGWAELRRIDVHSARRTRLLWVPESASLVALRPGPASSDAPESFVRTRADYAFGEPELADVGVPGSTSGLGPASRPAGGDADPIFASWSAVAREPLAERAADLDALAEPLVDLRGEPAPRRGRPARGRRACAWIAGVAAGAGLLGLWRRRRVVVRAAGACSLTALAAVSVLVVRDAAEAPGGAYASLHRLAAIACEVPPRAKTLCGVDCLYLGASLAGARCGDYARLVKLVRPGAQGTSLESLAVVADCVGIDARVVNPRAFDVPPDPLVAHVGPRHFVVVARLREGGVVVVDPARGLFRADWADLRGLLSPVALAVRGPA
jgi:hypothetical protein